MKMRYWICAVLLLLLSGCSYLTPPVALISGPEVKVQEKEAEAKQPATKSKWNRTRVTVEYPTTGIRRELPVGDGNE